MTVPAEEAPANYVPAAAVIRATREFDIKLQDCSEPQTLAVVLHNQLTGSPSRVGLSSVENQRIFLRSFFSARNLLLANKKTTATSGGLFAGSRATNSFSEVTGFSRAQIPNTVLLV